MCPLFKLICICSLLISCSAKQKIEYLNDLEQANIKGRVTKLITETHEVDSLGKAVELVSTTIEVFNKSGYTITDTARDFKENNEVVELLTYNSDGSLSSSSTFENKKLQSKMLLEYDDRKCVAIEIYDANGKLESYFKNIKQNNFGLLSGLDNYNTDGKLIMSYANDYDSIYQIKAIAKDSSGAITSEVNIQLTPRKYPTKVLEVTYTNGSALKKVLSYDYKSWDHHGNWIKQAVIDDRGKVIKLVDRIFSYED